MPIGRRGFLLSALSGAAGLAGLTRARIAFAAEVEAHTLMFHHIHTGENLKITYREHGDVVPGTLEAISHYLRDFRNGQQHPIDVALLDEVCRLHHAFDCRGHFEVISGYRSPKTNEALRHVSTGVAKNSLHIEGRAIDVRLTSAATAKLRDAAIAMRSGGVGYYPDSNFVHVDTGAVRTW